MSDDHNSVYPPLAPRRRPEHSEYYSIDAARRSGALLWVSGRVAVGMAYARVLRGWRNCLALAINSPLHDFSIFYGCDVLVVVVNGSPYFDLRALMIELLVAGAGRIAIIDENGLVPDHDGKPLYIGRKGDA